MTPRLGALAATLLLWAGLAAAQDRPEPPGSASLDLVFLGESKPVLLRFQFEVEGVPVQTVWNDYLRKWFDFLDQDSNGILSDQEVRGAPKAQFLFQLLRQGNFFPNTTTSLTPGDLGKKPNEEIHLADFTAYYQRSGLNPVQFSQAAPGASAARVSEILFKYLDQNKDGRLTREEMTKAVTSLGKLDINDDEWLTAAELSPGLANPLPPGAGVVSGFPQSGGRVGDAFYQIPGPDEQAALGALLLSHFDKDKNGRLSRAESGLDEKTFTLLDTGKHGDLDVAELSRWHHRPADLEFHYRLSRKPNQSRLVLHSSAERFRTAAIQADPRNVLLKLDDAQISLQVTDLSGSQGGRILPAEFYLQQFRAADTKKKGFLEMKDLDGRGAQFFRPLFPLLDRDHDGKMTEKELKNYTNLVAGAAGTNVSLSLVEQGRALFQLLDANRDGRLSLRELRSTPERLLSQDRDDDGLVSLKEIPRQFQVVMPPGAGRQPPPLADFIRAGPQPGARGSPRDTPIWFHKMDRNGDGDVSAKEFLGPREDFQRIDADGDGLLSPAEAAQAEAKMRPKDNSRR
jgi:Ca2+-binding EF-hand superfamily protein